MITTTPARGTDPTGEAEAFLAALPGILRCDPRTIAHQRAGARKLLARLAAPDRPAVRAADPTALIAKLTVAIARLTAAG